MSGRESSSSLYLYVNKYHLTYTTTTDSWQQSLYLGFSFTANNNMQGLQNQLYAFFMMLVLFGNINEQIMPMFVPQRALYEVRERPSKVYRWSSKQPPRELLRIVANIHQPLSCPTSWSKLL